MRLSRGEVWEKEHHDTISNKIALRVSLGSYTTRKTTLQVETRNRISRHQVGRLGNE